MENMRNPARSLKPVTPHASSNLPDGICRALWVGGVGDISLVADEDSSAVVLKGASGLVPIRVKAVRVTGTTATDIVALY